MARPLSEEKRNAILEAATKAVAALGVSASTAKIAKDAGIAEGTLFVYFPTKDDLLNQLYIVLKAEFRAAIGNGDAENTSIEARCRHLWNSFVDWGAHNPEKRRALRQLTVSEKITPASQRAGSEGFSDIKAMLEEGFASGVLRPQPEAFLGATIEALTDVTLDFIARDPGRREVYRHSGFEAFWGAISVR